MSTVPKPTNNRGARAYYLGHDIVDPVIGAGTFYVKYNYGTVPVEADGSACRSPGPPAHGHARRRAGSGPA
jgi:hypothetical protein